MDSHDPARLRISDEDRHQVAEVLRHAAGEGRIDLHELDERLEATYNAKTYGDLVPITADLPVRTTGAPPRLRPPVMPPVPPGPPAVPPRATPGVRPAGSTPWVPTTTYPTSFSFMGDCQRRGLWQVPQQHTAFAVMGSVTLDLREAVFETREVTINAYAIMAGIDIIVNPYTQVVVDGVGIMGDFSQTRDKAAPELSAASPVVYVKGLALMAGVTVRRKAMPGDSRKRLGRPR